MPKKPHAGKKVEIIDRFNFPKIMSCYTGEVREDDKPIRPDRVLNNPDDKISCSIGDSVDTSKIKFDSKRRRWVQAEEKEDYTQEEP